MLEVCMNELNKKYSKNDFLILNKSRLIFIKNQEKTGTISFPDFTIERNKISQNLINFIQENYK